MYALNRKKAHQDGGLFVCLKFLFVNGYGEGGGHFFSCGNVRHVGLGFKLYNRAVNCGQRAPRLQANVGGVGLLRLPKTDKLEIVVLHRNVTAFLVALQGNLASGIFQDNGIVYEKLVC